LIYHHETEEAAKIDLQIAMIRRPAMSEEEQDKMALVLLEEGNSLSNLKILLANAEEIVDKVAEEEKEKESGYEKIANAILELASSVKMINLGDNLKGGYVK